MSVLVEIPLPEEIDLDQIRDEKKNVKYIGKARRQADGTYRCLAIVFECLCVVEVCIKPVVK